MLRLFGVLLALPVAAAAQPLADHHQHLFSPVVASLISPAPPAAPTPSITAADLIRHLDAAGITRAAVLSTAYLLASPSRKLPNEHRAVMAENDWTAAQVAQFPERLVGFCSVNPLKEYALGEMIFINELVAAAPDVTIQVAHLGGAGGYEYPMIDAILDVFAEAIARKDPRMTRVWFDVTASASARTTPQRAEMIVRRIRQLGVERILYGSDAPASEGASPRARWAAFRALPLTDAEFQAIADNVPPYMR